MQRHVVRTLTCLSVSSTRMADGEDTGGFYYDTSAGDNGPPVGRKRRLIREGGLPLGSGIMFGPWTQEGEQCRLFPHNG